MNESETIGERRIFRLCTFKHYLSENVAKAL